VKGAPPGPEVTGRRRRTVAGVKTHRSSEIEAMTWQGIPVTTVARTLVDLAESLTADELARAVHEAGIRHNTTPEDVEAVLNRRPNSPGAGALRAVLRGDVHVTLSKLERAFLELLRGAGVQLPITNRPAGGRFVDCRWPEHKLTVELDSYRYHGSRHAWELDRRRERQAYARGDQFRRYTWGDVMESPRPTLRELRAVLDAH
jgi:very-short-patch-repair endonuclease